MLARCLYAALVAVAVVANTGCCGCRGWHGREWCGTGCGECYWSEWFNDPPDCHDPCDCYGNFAGKRHHPVMQAAHHAPGPTPASPEMFESFEEVPTPAAPGHPTLHGVQPTESEPTPAEAEYAPSVDGEETIETMPVEEMSEELPTGELPALSE